jgi:signal transduction histidine kinase
VTRRLLLSYLAITAIVLVALEIPLGRFYQQRETGRLTVGVERDATVLAGLYEEGLEQGAALDASLATDYAKRTGVRVVVVDEQGRSLIDTAGPNDRDFSSRPEIMTALRGQRATGIRHSDTLGKDLLYAAVPSASAGEVHGAVRLTLDTGEVTAAVHRFWLGLIAIAAVVLAVMAAVGWALARSVTRPLRRLTAAASRFATGDLGAASGDPHAPPEIAALGSTMNMMAQRLDQLLAEHRAFVADASHQLRTPLTALRLRLENLQSDLSGSPSSDDLTAAIDETNRLTALVTDLLQLARVEQTAAPEAVDLVGCARERVDTWAAIADAGEVKLDLVAPALPVRVRAVANGIEQILDNLIDNAILASPPGGTVRVSVGAGEQGHHLTVIDEGPGLADDAKTQALTRFWRSDDASPGTGLGLPIARALAEASGGCLVLEDAPAGGLAVRVTLPAADVAGRKG